MKLYFLTVLCVLGSNYTFATDTKIDSLLHVISRAADNQTKAKTLNLLAEEYQGTNPKLMLKYAQKAGDLKVKNSLIAGKSFHNIGISNLILGNYTAALQNFTNAKNKFENALKKKAVYSQKEAKNGLARAYGCMGIVYSEQSNISKALLYYLKAIKLNREINNLDNTARLYNNVGIVYLNHGKKREALNYLHKCLNLQIKLNDPTIGITFSNIGNIYRQQGEFNKAIYFFKKALASFKKHPDPRGLGELYNNIGLYYQKINNLSEALKNYSFAIEEFNSIDDKFGISNTYSYLGDIYFKKGDYQKAIDYTQLALKFSKELNVLEQVKDAEKKMYEIYTKTNQPTLALEHFIAFTKANDSIQSYENVRNNIRAELNFEFDKKELLHKKEKEKSTFIYHEKIKRNELKLLFISLFSIAFFTFLFLLYKRQQVNKTLTLKLELIEYEQKALHLQMNPHFVFNCLGSISSFILQNNIDEAVKYLSKFSKLMRLTLEFSKEPFIPIDKEIKSLENYLELEKLRFNNLFSYKITKTALIEDDMAIPSLLLQPFVENAIIHGVGVKKEHGIITIDFTIENEQIICTITDNGIGIFNSQKNKKNLVNLHKSMALEITKKRLEMMETILLKKSQIEINEMVGANNEIVGTKITLNLPLQYMN